MPLPQATTWQEGAVCGQFRPGFPASRKFSQPEYDMWADGMTKAGSPVPRSQ